MSKRSPDYLSDGRSRKVKAELCLEHRTQLAGRLEQEKTLLDEIVVHLELDLIFQVLIAGDILDVEDFSRLASVNWTWFMLFHKFALWIRLAEHSMGQDRRGRAYGAKFNFIYPAFEARYGAARCPGALMLRLNLGLLSACKHCHYDTMMQGKRNIPLAAFKINGDKFSCVNPKCKKTLRGRCCDFELSDVFAACEHKLVSLDVDLIMPGQKEPIDSAFDYCERCGLLRDIEDSIEEDYCPACLAVECICKQCSLCKLMPVSCRCEPCELCKLCTGCKACTQLCECQYCSDCDQPPGECECISEYDF